VADCLTLTNTGSAILPGSMTHKSNFAVARQSWEPTEEITLIELQESASVEDPSWEGPKRDRRSTLRKNDLPASAILLLLTKSLGTLYDFLMCLDIE
jgi:hypothetical protein